MTCKVFVRLALLAESLCVARAGERWPGHVHIAVGNTHGCPAAVKHFDALYQVLQAGGLAKKGTLIGISRGGLYAYNFAAEDPSRVACIYGDAPVTLILEQRYRALGGKIVVLHKPGGEHHPHGLDNPQPIVDFILKHAR